MEIKKVEMKNFKPYREAEINFEDKSEGKNLYLIVGKNNVGKTSFLDAIKWAFYEHKPSETKSFMNKRAKKEGNCVTEVHVILDHDGNTYDFERKAKIKEGKFSQDVDLSINGEKKRTSKNEKISELLPREISEYFFFDGEDIRKLANTGRQEEVKGKIERLLGLIDLRKATDHLEDIKSDLNNKIDKEIAKETKETRKELEELKNAGEKLKAKKNNLDEEINDLKKKKDKLENKREELGLKGIEKKRKSIEELDSQITQCKKKIDKLIEDLTKIRNYSYLFILEDRIDELSKELNEKKENSVPHKEKIINKSIEKGSCIICGHTIDQKSEDRFKELQNKGAGQNVWHNLDTLNKAKSHLSNLKKDLGSPSEIREALRKERKKKSNLKDKKQDINLEIDKETRKKSKNLADNIKKIREKIDKKIKHQGKLEDRIENKEDEIAEKREDWKKKKGINRKQESLNEQLNLVEKCIGKLEDLRETTVSKDRKEIKNKVWKCFDEIWKGDEYKDIEFKGEKGYDFQLIEKDGVKPDMDQIGDGVKLIVAISFVLGLNKYSGLDAPLLMNAVLDPLDIGDHESLVKFLGNSDEQIILLLLDASLEPGDTRNIIEKNMVQENRIVKKEMNSSIR
ncbi:MAG: AAA family ATPase [Candidatus Thermoplasmatota archaeon]